MRIVLAHNEYRHAGGEERHIDLIATTLRSFGHDVRRYGASSAGITAGRRVAVGLTMVYRPRAARDLRSFLSGQPADVVHFHNITPLLTPAALRAAKLSGAAVVLTAHNYRLVCAAGTLMRRGRKHTDCIRSSLLCGVRGSRTPYIESVVYGTVIELQRRFRLVERWVDAIVAPSEYVAAFLVSAGLPRSKMHVVPHGVESPRTPVRHGEYALYAGRLSEEKGISTLLRARARTPVPLVVAGDGPLRGRVESSSAVTYLGPLEPAELADVRARAAFAVVPSECPEALGLSAVEALAQGLPVISTPNGGLAEVAANGGVLVVPERDEHRLAEAMTRLWDDKTLRDQLAAEALASAKASYGLQRQTQRLVEIYERVTA